MDRFGYFYYFLSVLFGFLIILIIKFVLAS